MLLPVNMGNWDFKKSGFGTILAWVLNGMNMAIINAGIYLFVLYKMQKAMLCERMKVSKGTKIKNRYNQVPHLTEDTNGKVTNSQLYTSNQNQEVSPFPAGDHKAQINRRAQRHKKHKTEKSIKNPQKKDSLGTVS